MQTPGEVNPVKKEWKESRAAAVLCALLTALLVLTGAVAVPVLCRPFYYAHIEYLDLPLRSGLTAQQVRQTYDLVMDYCLGLRPDFTAGVLPFSESGAAHFADVRGLFLLDLGVLAACGVLLPLCALLFRALRLRPRRLAGHGPGFWGAAGLGVLMLLAGAAALLNFRGAFRALHYLLFPGRTNWYFDLAEDPVILLLPRAFFRDCAFLVIGLILLWCAVLMAADILTARRLHRTRQQVPAGCPGASACPGAASCPGAGNCPGIKGGKTP